MEYRYDPRGFYKPGDRDIPPALQLVGTESRQELLKELMIKAGEEEPFDGRPKWQKLTGVKISADMGNPYDRYGAVVATVGGEVIGHLPRHTAAFYRDAIAGNTVPVDAAAVIAAGKDRIGCRIYGSGPDSPLAVYPEDAGWIWNPVDDKYGYWSKEGEVPRPVGLAEAMAAYPGTSDGRG